MPLKRNIISVKKGIVPQIAQSQNVSIGTVYAALNYTSNSESAQVIRKLALEIYGGVITRKVIW